MFDLSFLRLILIVLVASTESQCSGYVQCYTCAWLTTGSGTKEKEDNCRPGRLDVNGVVKEYCQKGCYSTIIYEYDPKNNASSQAIQDLKDCKMNDMNSPHPSNMTLFARKCSDKSFINDHCLIKSVPGFHAEERFCRTNLCNGENGTASLASTVLWTKLSSILLFSALLSLLQLYPTINSKLYSAKTHKHNSL